jgi:hypothetical protein
MPTTYSPSDPIIGPIITSLHDAIQAQIPSVARIYVTEPDGAFENNSVWIPEPTWEVKGDTNAKLYLCITFSIRHIVNRNLLADSLPLVRSYLYPYLMVLATWANQSLSGNAIVITIKKGGSGQFVHAGINHVALLMTVEVMTEFNIPLT